MVLLWLAASVSVSAQPPGTPVSDAADRASSDAVERSPRDPAVSADAVDASAAHEADDQVHAFFEEVARVDAWSFFHPGPGGGQPDYWYAGHRASLGVGVDTRRLNVRGAVRYAQLVHLPTRAVGPGPLGPGAAYHLAARASHAYQLYFKTISLRLREVVPGLSIEGGRMPYASGEGTAFAGRLIGGAEWTMFERAFDGVRLDYAGAGWSGHASYVLPTQGAFEESANPTLTRVRIASAAWGLEGLQLFAHHYRDTRGVAARPDNTGRRARRVDVSVQTLGGSLEWEGPADVRVWAAGQRGRWFGDAHRAFSASIEGGYRWSSVRWKPQARAGFLWASGDDDPGDAVHGTFFPMVPTARPDLAAGLFAPMNLRHASAHSPCSRTLPWR